MVESKSSDTNLASDIEYANIRSSRDVCLHAVIYLFYSIGLILALIFFSAILRNGLHGSTD